MLLYLKKGTLRSVLQMHLPISWWQVFLELKKGLTSTQSSSWSFYSHLNGGWLPRNNHFFLLSKMRCLKLDAMQSEQKRLNVKKGWKPKREWRCAWQRCVRKSTLLQEFFIFLNEKVFQLVLVDLFSRHSTWSCSHLLMVMLGNT